MSGLIERLIDRLVDLQIPRPAVPLAVAAALTRVFGWFTSKLELNTRYEALLPDNQPSVQELHRIERRTSSAQTVLIVLEGPDGTALRALGDALVPQLLALGPAMISSVEDGPHEARRFLSARAALFLERGELERLRAQVEARWAYEVQKASGLLLIDDETPPPEITAADLEQKAAKSRGGADLNRYPDGYYQRKDGTALVVSIRSPIAGGDLGHIGPALDAIHATVAAVKQSQPAFAGVRVTYAGDMTGGFIEYGVVKQDLASVGGLGIALILSAVLLFFMRFRAMLVMGITIGVGLIWTFGLTQIVIGHLNLATAFLVSIVAGNGINVGILYQARYFEQRNLGHSPEDSLHTAVRATWQPTIIAALASAAAYGSLLTTDFRAFRDFGFIAAVGMLLCWVVKTLMVPPLLILVHRPGPPRAPRFWHRFEMAYGRPFAWRAARVPGPLLALAVLVAVGGVVAGVRYATTDPMEYDMRHVQNDRRGTADLHHAWAVATEILGGSQGAMVVLTDTPAQARDFVATLRARWDAAPADAKPFVAVHSLWDFIPEDQAAKLPTALALGERLLAAHRRGFIAEKDWARLRELLPPKDLKPFGIQDLPEAVVRPFTEKDGTRGTLALVESEPTKGDDLRYLLRYADSYRETLLPSGAVVRGSGSAVIFGDMLKATVHDIPKAIAFSLGLTLLAVFVTFRRGRHSLAVLFSLLVATGGVALFLALARIKLNFLNFAALPVTFGIGVDYSINVVQRYLADGGRDILRALRTSGGAVVLCSLTTMLGYFALLGSHNLGIRSLGAIAAVGEVSCLLAAVLVIPALYLVLERRRG